MKIFALLFLCTLAAAKDLRNDINPKVHSSSGIYEGSILKSQLGKDIFAFRGIPYAEPPTGQHRFKAPIKANPHKGIYDATQEGPICPQSYKGHLAMSEDCLRINIYSPTLPKNSSDGTSIIHPNKPVIFFIHSGGFISSSGSSYDLGPQFVLDQDVVFVTINYRLGALGFLSTGDSIAPGNAGLKDQVLALKWVQENIADFGGNPNKVTLMGLGAGAQCVSLHIVSPMSKGLFHRAIMFSGATTTQNPLPTNRDDLVRRQAQSLGCPIETFQNMSDCFYTKSTNEFIQSDEELIKILGASDPIYIPVIEKKNSKNDNNEELFLTEQPVHIITQGKFNSVPLFIGSNRDEHGPIVILADEQAQKGNTTLIDELNNSWDVIAPKRFAYESGTPRSLNISRKFRSLYLNDKPVKAGNYHGVAKLYADALTNFHVHRFERLIATYSTKLVYYYHNMHQNCDSYSKWSNGTNFGVAHYDELSLLFNVGGRPAHCENDVRAANEFWGFVADFARNGELMSENKDKDSPVKWMASTKEHPQYLEYSDNMKMVQGVIYQDRMNLWDELFPLESTDVMKNNKNPRVNSPAGIFEGSMMKSQLGKDIYAFRGIRYAEPPTGQKRFKEPNPIKPHEGIYDATQDGAICPQLYKGHLPMSEDCLHLNVYTTQLPQNSSDGTSIIYPNKPVIVYIHGGGFIESSGSSYDLGPQILLDTNIVLVTFNYRLGVFGFLNSDDSHAPGNAGLKDQVLVLKWVQENIAAFGGNPNLVTLMGQGAGSMSISLHIVSPMSTGLFNHALMMSGAATFQLPIPSVDVELLKETAQTLGCPFDKVDEMFNCFYTKSTEEFVKANQELTNLYGSNIPVFTPVIEHITSENDNNKKLFLTGQPDEIIRQGDAYSVPLCIGINTDELGYFVIAAEEQAQKGNTTLYNELYQQWNKLAPKRFVYEKDTSRSTYISDALKSFYFGNGTFGVGNSHGLAKLHADSLTNFHVHRYVTLMAAHSSQRVYHYLNAYQSCNTKAKWSNGTRFGVVHGDETLNLFIVGDPTQHCQENPAKIAEMIEIVGTFAETGNPIPDSKVGKYPVQWQPTTKDQPQYLEYGSESMKMIQGVIYPERMNKWDELFPLTPTDVMQNNKNPRVNSPAGIYEGSMMKSQLGKDIYAFRGIRYAEPPTGQKRFKPSSLAKRHNGTFDATKDGPICPQPNAGSHEESEDCLRLNVYTTALPDGSHQPNKSVLAFIHPGGIATPTGMSYELRPHFVLDEDLVFVIINYRVGALGYLSTGDERAPGNVGLKDQVLALRWIQQNIAAFGGNPKSVTLYGHSESSVSVTLHMVSPMSKGLFQRALTSSGAATTGKPLPTTRINLAKEQAEVLGCPIDTLDKMFDCLYEKSPQQFLDSYSKLIKSNDFPQQVWTPVIEQAQNNQVEPFLDAQPEDLILRRNFSSVPLFIGINKDENRYLVITAEEQAQKGNTTLYDKMNNNWETNAPEYFGYESDSRSSHISEELKTFYLRGEPLKANNYDGLANLFADILTNFPIHRFERLITAHSTEPVYYYLNRYKNCDTLVKWSNGTHFGTVHHDEMPLLYNIDGRPKHCDKDVIAANLVWKLVANFAITSDPTPENKSEDFPVKWTASTKDQPQYFDFTGDSMKMVPGLIYQERMNILDELFPLAIQK